MYYSEQTERDDRGLFVRDSSLLGLSPARAEHSLTHLPTVAWLSRAEEKVARIVQFYACQLASHLTNPSKPQNLRT